jgi:hypothetical protein
MRTPPLLREEIRRRRPLGLLLERRAMSKLPPSGGQSPWADLIAFIAVLAAVILLIVLGKLTAAGVTSVCAAIVGLYGAWRRFR